MKQKQQAMAETLPQKQRAGIRALFYENRFCALAFFCAAVIMVLVFYCFDMVPFGDVTILRMDLYHQYGPLFAELYERVKNGQSLIYSWNTSLGGTFLGNFFNYLSSPTLLVIFLFKHVDLPDSIALMVLLKASFAAAFFTYYLRKTQERNDHVTAAFGVLYAFCGFFIAYYWNVMWIDAMALFPLAMLGIERIIQRRSFLLYTVSLAAIMVTNYYMAMMVCIFSVLYFLVRFAVEYTPARKTLTVDTKRLRNAVIADLVITGVLAVLYIFWKDSRSFSTTAVIVIAVLWAAAAIFFAVRQAYPTREGFLRVLKRSQFIRAGATFAFSAVLAACLALFALLPTYFILKNCSATSGTFPKDMKIYYDIFDFLANHLASVDPTIRSSGEDVLPNVYCGILTVMLVPLYLINRSIKLRERIFNVLLLAVLYFSFNINYANYVWHGFHFPNDLPYRFSFMYSFILLLLAFRAICRIREYSGRELLLTGVGVMAFIVLVQKVGSKNVSDNTVLISLAFAFVYTLVLYAMRSKRFQAGSIALLLLCCVISEAAIADTDNYSMNQTKANYSGDYEDFADVKTKLDGYHGGKMYRMELANLRTRMDPAWYNYQGISTFSSMAPEKLSNLQSRLGMYGNFINSFTYNPQTPVYNAMMGLRYVVKKKDSTGLENEDLYTLRVQNTTYEAYENNYCLPVAFCVNTLVENWNDSESNPFAVQSDFLRRAAFAEGVFTPMIVEDVYCDNLADITADELTGGYADLSKLSAGSYGSVTVTISALEEQNCYLYVKSGAVDTIYVNGETLNETQNIDEAYILDLGKLRKGEKVNVEIPMKDDAQTGSVTFHACGLDMGTFTEAFKTLQKGQMEITSFTETRIEGDVQALPGQILYTSIPYDDGWHIFIDGRRVSRDDYLRIGDALLGVRIDGGSHHVVMDYSPVGLYGGATVSVLTLVCLILGFILVRRHRERTAFRPLTPEVAYLEETPDTPEYLMEAYGVQPLTDGSHFCFTDPFAQDDAPQPGDIYISGTAPEEETFAEQDALQETEDAAVQESDHAE